MSQPTTVQIVECAYKQFDSIISQENLTEPLLTPFVAGVEWISVYTEEGFVSRGKVVTKIKHGIGGQLYSAVIATDCNELSAQYGRRLVVRNSTDLKLVLECFQHKHPKYDIDNAEHDKPNEHKLAAVVTKSSKSSKLTSADASDVHCQQPDSETVKKRQYVSKQNNCQYHLVFLSELVDPKNPKSNRTWRLDVEKSSSAHSCEELSTLKEGGVLYLNQFTLPMMQMIGTLSAAEVRPHDMLKTLQKEFKKPYIAYRAIQNVLLKLKPPAREQERHPEMTDLLNYFASHSQDIVWKCDYLPTIENGQQVNEIWNVFFATKQMIRMFKEYGQLLVIDATYNVTNFTMKLLIFTIRTGTGGFTIAAVALIQEESEHDIGWVIEQLMEHAGMTVGDENGIVKCVITDGAPVYPGVLKSVMPGAAHQLCVWHQRENMTNVINKWAVDSKEANELLSSCIFEADPEEPESKWTKLQKKHLKTSLKRVPPPPTETRAQRKERHKLNRLETSIKRLRPQSTETEAERKKRHKLNRLRRNARALFRSWYDNRHKYWKAYTKDNMNIGAASSQGGEAMNAVMKPTTKALTLTQVIELTTAVTTRHVFKQVEAIDRARIAVNRHTSITDWTDILRCDISLFAVEKLTLQLALADENRYQRSGDQFAVTNSTHAIEVDIRAMTCKCGFRTQYVLLCRHLLALRDEELENSGETNKDTRRAMLAVESLKYAHPRWRHEALFRVLNMAVRSAAPRSLNFISPHTNTSQAECNQRPSVDQVADPEHSSYTASLPEPAIAQTEVSLDIEFNEYVERMQIFRSKARDAKIAVNVVLREVLAQVEHRRAEMRTEMRADRPTENSQQNSAAITAACETASVAHTAGTHESSSAQSSPLHQFSTAASEASDTTSAGMLQEDHSDDLLHHVDAAAVDHQPHNLRSDANNEEPQAASKDQTTTGEATARVTNNVTMLDMLEVIQFPIVDPINQRARKGLSSRRKRPATEARKGRQPARKKQRV